MSPASADTTGEPTTAEFDVVANTLSHGLTAQLESLRAVVVKAESAREADRAEIARLTAELADRNGTIESMQQKLREFADTLDHGT